MTFVSIHGPGRPTNHKTKKAAILSCVVEMISNYDERRRLCVTINEYMDGDIVILSGPNEYRIKKHVETTHEPHTISNLPITERVERAERVKAIKKKIVKSKRIQKRAIDPSIRAKIQDAIDKKTVTIEAMEKKLKELEDATR